MENQNAGQEFYTPDWWDAWQRRNLNKKLRLFRKKRKYPIFLILINTVLQSHKI